MNKILVLGAGRSSSALISYLLENAQKHQWQVTVGDVSLQAVQARIGNHPNSRAILFDIENEEASKEAIRSCDLVISLIPAHLHPKVAKLCVDERKHMLTASYISDAMQALDDVAKQNGLLLLNECGLDPGIDHMSAMQVIDRIKNTGGRLTSFESFTGGLIAPSTDPQNPWRYKFTWNPRNVIMAGQGTAKFLQEGRYKYIPYQQLFKRITSVQVPGHGAFEGYANRDSLKYLETYGLQGIKTMLRGTLRYAGYCGAWDVLVQLGCCDDTYQVDGLHTMTHRDFISSFLDTVHVEEEICKRMGILKDGEEMKRLQWIGLFSQEKVGLDKGTPAQALEHIFNKKWALRAGDKDFIVMWHRFRYQLNGVEKEIQAYLTATGDNEINTAMAKTVGLPLAIAAKLLMLGKIRSRGVAIPVTPEFYEPILQELGTLGIGLHEQEMAQ